MILDYIRRQAEYQPNKPAITTADETITYAQLYQKMQNAEPLPIPLLGESWNGPFCLHTTGTTGIPKDIIISGDAVIANSENLIDRIGFTPQQTFIIAGDMEHLGCWSKIFPVLMVGGTLHILKDRMRDIEAFFRVMEDSEAAKPTADANGEARNAACRGKRFATFLVPSNIRILLQFSAERLARLSHSIDFIETGAAPMPHADMLELCRLMPQSRLFNTYASTETGVICSYNYNDGRCLPGCCGKPMMNSEVIITSEGKIACKGRTLCSTAEGQQTIFVTNDNGYLDDEGMLHILGRQDDIINVGGYNVSPSEVEDVAMTLPDISDCICIATPHPITTWALKLLVVLSDGYQLDKRRIAKFINEKLERYKVPMQYEAVDHIERTANGKANRKYYRQKG